MSKKRMSRELEYVRRRLVKEREMYRMFWRGALSGDAKDEYERGWYVAQSALQIVGWAAGIEYKWLDIKEPPR